MLIATAGCNLPNKQSEESKTGVEEPAKENAVTPETEKAPEQPPAGNVTGAPTEQTQPPAEGVQPPAETQAPPAEAPAQAPPAEAPAETPPPGK